MDRGLLVRADAEELLRSFNGGDEMMTEEEWLSHSEEWRKGYSAYANGEEMPFSEWLAQSDEWKIGYSAAVRGIGLKPM